MITLLLVFGRNVKDTAPGLAAVVIALGASTLAIANMSGAIQDSVLAGEPAATATTSVPHYETFLATPRWSGSWTRNR